MKKSAKIVTVILIIGIAVLVGVYAVLVNRARTRVADTKLTPVQSALNRDLDKNYPPTVKEVVKYYTDIEQCFYNEECTDAEIEALGTQARKLYDDELRTNNEMTGYIERLKADVRKFKEAKWRLSAVSVAGSSSVDYFSEDDYNFARIYCDYTVKDSAGKLNLQSRVYLLRQDEDRRWKIYGWDNADNVHVGQE